MPWRRWWAVSTPRSCRPGSARPSRATRRSTLAVVGATLAVGAAFQPARRRIQAAVDRRFNRRRHDAARLIESFGSHLRSQVDLDTLTAELLAVAEQTMQPTRA